jgi:hypothetical protein
METGGYHMRESYYSGKVRIDIWQIQQDCYPQQLFSILEVYGDAQHTQTL